MRNIFVDREEGSSIAQNLNRSLFILLTFLTAVFSPLFAHGGEVINQTKEGSPPEVAPYFPFTVGLEGSTLGLGGWVGWRFSDLLGVRAGLDYFQLGLSEDVKGVRYKNSLELLSEPVTLDVYPWKSHPFHFSIGLLVNENRLDGSSYFSSKQTYRLAGTTYAAPDVGHLNSRITQNSVAPYLGFGGNLFYFDPAHHWALTGELGVTYLGGASADLHRSGGVANDTALGSQINHSVNAEVGRVRDFGDDFQWWPVARLGVSYSF